MLKEKSFLETIPLVIFIKPFEISKIVFDCFMGDMK